MTEEAVQTIDFGIRELTTDEIEDSMDLILQYLGEEGSANADGSEVEDDDVLDRADELIDAMDKWTTQWIMNPSNGLNGRNCDVDDLETDDDGVHWYRITAPADADVPLQAILNVMEDTRTDSGICEVAVQVFGTEEQWFAEFGEEDYEDECEDEEEDEDGEY